MRILLTNDDGYDSFGIKALHGHLSEIADVEVLAPKRNCSGYGSALSIGRELPTPVKVGDHVHYLEATPADCAYVGLNSSAVGGHFDILVSGINFGDNLSTDIFSSGTIGAAMQGNHLFYPPVAVSLASDQRPPSTEFDNYEPAAAFTAKFVKMLFTSGANWKKRVLFNINVPPVDQSGIAGAVWTRLAPRGPAGPCGVSREKKYWIGRRGHVDSELYSDVMAVDNNYISITPMHNDLTMVEPRSGIHEERVLSFTTTGYIYNE